MTGIVQELLVVYADGQLELQNLGLNYAVTFFTYEVDPMGGPDIKVPILKLIRPKTALFSIDCPLAQELDRMPDPTKRVKFHA